MRLIEKKCPNCGADLEFGENDKSCKCSYCKRSFEIERDEKLDVANMAEQFSLNELKTPFKYIGSFMIVSYAVGVILFLIVFGLIGFGVYSNIKGNYYNNVNQFSNEDFGDFDNKAYFTIEKNDDNLKRYRLDMNPKRQKIYLVYNKKKDVKNLVYVLYKTTYQTTFGEDKQVVYVPIKYENLKKQFGSLIFQLDNGSVEGSKFYLTSDNSEYTYGYKDIKSIKKDIIESFSKEYKISKK